MAKRPAVHVTSTGAGWKVKSAGAERAARITATQAEAVQVGRRIAANRGSELVIHRTDGKIRSKDSFGNDPFPPRDNEH
jgi:hypothetical protein